MIGRDRIQYLLSRLIEMPAGALAHKAALLFRKWVHFGPYLAQKSQWFVPLGHPREIENIEAFGRAVVRQYKRNQGESPILAKAALARADLVVSGNFPCLAFGVGRIPKDGGWHEDHFHGFRWPCRYFPLCDYVAADSYCDVKVPWEYSRLQYLVWLAEGSIQKTDKSEEYFANFLTIVENWQDSNPTGWGINWTCAMEVAIRGVNLGLALAIFFEKCGQEQRSRLVGLLKEHYRYVKRFPERSDVPGNHYLANLMGLYVMACLLFGPESSHARRHAREFSEEASRQFEAAGGHFEHAVIYHRLCLEMVALVAALEVRVSGSHVQLLLSILERGVDLCKAVCSSVGVLPVIGDADSGHVLWFFTDSRQFRGLRQFVEYCFSERLPEDAIDPLGFWYLALMGADLAPKVTATRSEKYEPGLEPQVGDWGYLASGRLDDTSVVLRIGGQGLEGRAPHDHDDALSVWLFKDDREIVVDAGCHSYTLDPGIREADILSTSHNVPQPRNGSRYAPVHGSVFRTVRGAPTAKLLSLGATGQTASLGAKLETDSLSPTKFRECQRRITLQRSRDHVILEVADCWKTAKDTAVDVLWHLGPDLEPDLDENKVELRLTSGDRRKLAILDFESGSHFSLNKFEYRFSPDYGSCITCFGLRVAVDSEQNGALLTRFRFLS